MGDTGIWIAKVKTEKVPLKGPFGDKTSHDEHMVIYIAIINRSETKKLTYKSWRGSLFRSNCKLTDEFDNRYRVMDFGIDKPLGSVEDESIYPQKQIVDVLVFEKPIDKAKSFKLELDGQSLWLDDTLRFKFPTSFDFKKAPRFLEKPAPAAEKEAAAWAEKENLEFAQREKDRKASDAARAERKYEQSLRTLPGTKRATILLGSSPLALTESVQNKELRLQFLKSKDLIELTEEVTVSLVEEGKDFSKVKYGEKTYYVGTKYLVPMKK